MLTDSNFISGDENLLVWVTVEPVLYIWNHYKIVYQYLNKKIIHLFNPIYQKIILTSNQNLKITDTISHTHPPKILFNR